MRSLLILGACALFTGCVGSTADGSYTSNPSNSSNPSNNGGQQSSAQTQSTAQSHGAGQAYSSVQQNSSVAQSEGPQSSASSADNTGDNYEPVGANPFVMAEHDPLSTFAIDVDTASYDIFRRDVGENGVLPLPSSVRVEEYLNAFSYGYTVPEFGSDEPFSVSLDASPSVFDRATSLVRVGIQAAVPSDLAETPANIVFLVDLSGSMGHSDDKLPYVKTLLKQAVQSLRPTDTLSIVSYSTSTKIWLEQQVISSDYDFDSLIDRMSANGRTAGAQGMQRAYEVAERGFISGGINHVVMCTDGDFNLGLTGDALVDFIAEKRSTGITYTALGFGTGNLNDAMMEATTNAGDGIYTVITSAEDAQDYAATRLLNNLYYVAKDVKVQVEFNADLVAAYRLIGYENRAIADADFENTGIDGGEIGAGLSVTALYEVAFTEEAIPMVSDLEIEDGAAYDGDLSLSGDEFVGVTVRFKERLSQAGDPDMIVSAALSDSLSSIAVADSDLQWAAAVAAFAEALKNSPYADETLLGNVEQLLMQNAGEDDKRREFVELVARARLLMMK